MQADDLHLAGSAAGVSIETTGRPRGYRVSTARTGLRKLLQGTLSDRVFKVTALLFSVTTVVLLVGALLSLVTRTTPSNLLTSITSHEIQFAIKLSLITSISSTALCIVMAVPAAYVLTRYRFRGRGLINVLIQLPLALPPIVAGMALLILFGATGFGKTLADAGINFVFTTQGIILAQFFVTIPFMYRIMRTTFQGINPRYEHVAKTLGCTDLEVFRRVTLPMAKNGLMAGAVIAWCRALGEFGAALMLAGATRMRTETLPSALYLNMTSGNLPLAISAATILIAIAFLALLMFERVAGNSRVF